MKKITPNFIVSTLFLGVISFIFLNSCSHKDHGGHKSKYSVTKPWRENLEIKKEFVAQIRSVQHVDLRTFEKGYLQNIFVDEGQFVKKDQPMFQIMPFLMQAELQKAKAEYDMAEIEFKNTSQLAKKKVVSMNELALVKAKLEKAKAELNLAQTHLDFTTIKAPFDGIMDRFHVRLGSLLEEGELLTTLSDNSNMWVYFNVSEVDYLDYMAHKKDRASSIVKLILPNGEMFKYDGKIDTIEADFNNETGNVAFRATFPNPDGLLRHGETGNIQLTEPLENAFVIPQKATFEVLDKKFVYVVDENHTIKTKQITIAEEVPHLFVVKSGLDENDTILLEGLGKVKLGDKVETQYEGPERVLASLKLKAE